MRDYASGPRRARLYTAVIALAGVCVLGSAAAAQPNPASPIDLPGGVRLERVHHNQNLLPDREHAGFSSLLYNSKGELVLHDGDKTWLYTTGLFEAPTGGQRDWYGKWISHVREFNVRTLVSGEKTIALGLADADQWAVIHDVVKVGDGLYVAFYSTNGGVRAAVADKPDGMFKAVPNFKIAVTDKWEIEGGERASLESNGAHVLIEDTDQAATMWLGYDSYHVDKTAGQLGWAKIRIDKAARTVELVEKHPSNPLAMLPQNYIAARSGGNLPTDLRIGNEYAYFYYTRPEKQKIMLTAALSTDPLFQKITNVIELEPPLDGEKVIEKFEAFMVGGDLNIMYENQLTSGHWGTGLRIYKLKQ